MLLLLLLTGGQLILTRGRIAGKFFIGEIYCETRLLLRSANRNDGRQHAGNSQRQGHWERCSASCRKFPTSSP